MRTIAVLLLLGLACRGFADTAADLAAMEADVAALRALRDKARADLPATDKPPVTLRLQFQNFVIGSGRFGDTVRAELLVTLRHGNGLWLVESATTPRWLGGEHVAELAGGSLNGKHGAGDLTVHMAAGRVDRHYLAGGTVSVHFAVDIVANRLAGTYVTAGAGGLSVPARSSGSVTGTIQTEVAPVLAAFAKPEESLEKSPAQLQRERAQWHEKTAESLYQEIRACVIAKATGLPLEHTWSLAKLRLPDWPKTDGKLTPATKKTLRKTDIDLDSGLEEPGVRSSNQQEEVTGSAQTRQRVAVRRRGAERQLASKSVTMPATVGSVAAAPEIGPWYGEEILPKGNIVAADEPGWAAIGDWECLGPFTAMDRRDDTPWMPALIPAFDAPYKTELAPRGKDGPSTEVKSAPGVMQRGTGLVRPAGWGPKEDDPEGGSGFPLAMFFARTTLTVPGAGQYWASVALSRHGKLWVNEELAWTTPAILTPPNAEETRHVFRLRLQKGTNRLLFRCDSGERSGAFALHLGPAAERLPATSATAAKAESKTVCPLQGTQGWRNDGSGRYPQAKPPLAWDAEKGINVLWRVPLDFSFATPLVVGEKVITMEEPHTIICLERKTGQELWRREADIADLLDETTRAEAAPLQEKATKAKQELARLGAQKNARKDALVKAGLSDAEVEAKLRALEQDARGYQNFIREKVGFKDPGWYQDIGHSYPTPVTDGRQFWVKLNTGVLACYDLEGNRRWLVNHGGSAKSSAVTSSPLKLDDKIILFVHQAEAGGKEASVQVLKAFAAETGQLLWTAAPGPRGDWCGTPAALRLRNGRESLDVIITPNGMVVRAGDGKMLRRYLGAAEHYGSPLATETGTVYFAPNSVRVAVDFWLVDRDTIGVRRRWKRGCGDHFQDGDYGVLHQDVLIYSKPLLDLFDAVTGDPRGGSGNIFFCRPGRGYAPVALAGDKLYVADNAQWFQPTSRPRLSPYPAGLSVVEARAGGLVLAMNQVEPVHGGYGFDEERLYVRSRHSLMCFGYQNDAGRAYEAETVAREVLRQIYPAKPLGAAPISVPVEPVNATTKGGTRLPVNGMIWQWSCRRGSETKQLDPRNLLEWGEDGRLDAKPLVGNPHIGLTEVMGQAIDLAKLGGAKVGATAVFETPLRTEYAMTLLFDPGHPGARATLGGVEVRPGQALHIGEGLVTLSISVPLESVAGAARYLRPRFWPQQDAAAWRQRLEQCRPYLEKVIALAPESVPGKQAKELLKNQ